MSPHFEGAGEEVYVEPEGGDRGACAVCAQEIILRKKIFFKLTDPPGTPTTMTLEWEHENRWWARQSRPRVKSKPDHRAELGDQA